MTLTACYLCVCVCMYVFAFIILLTSVSGFSCFCLCRTIADFCHMSPYAHMTFWTLFQYLHCVLVLFEEAWINWEYDWFENIKALY